MVKRRALATKLHDCGIHLKAGGRDRRRSMHECIGGQSQGGINTPQSVKSILIFTGSAGHKYGYVDEWIDDTTFLYTGEGQKGDMEMIRGNRAMRDHQKDGKELHLFEIETKGYVEYVGQMGFVDYEWRIDPDVEGKGSRNCEVSSKACRLAPDDNRLGSLSDTSREEV